jgi:TonB family protein
VADGTEHAARAAPRAPVEIIDMVFRDRLDRPRRRTLLAAAVVMALYGGAALLMVSTKASRSSRGADLDGRRHAERAQDRAVELLPPPPRAEPAPAVAQRAAGREPVRRSTARAPRRASPVAPARAAAVLTRAAPEAPLDLTGNVFASGDADSFPGGASAGAGRTTAPVTGTIGVHAPAANRPTVASASLARPVALAAGTWICPWPSEADAEQIDQQTVVIRVRVAPEGTVVSAQLVADPGTGFGHAAMTCARQTRFEPALDIDGHPMASWSPPIRVHFSR